MEQIDEMWEKALQIMPREGDTVIERQHEDPGAGVLHSYTIYTQQSPVYITRPMPTIIRVFKRKEYAWEDAPALLAYDDKVIAKSSTPEDDDMGIWGWTQDQESWDYRTIDSHYRTGHLWPLYPERPKEKNDD